MSLIQLILLWLLLSPFAALIFCQFISIGTQYDEDIAELYEGLGDVTEKS